jgi:hypothetical protein
MHRVFWTTSTVTMSPLWRSMQGSRSKWSGYLQALPQTPVQIALLWGSDEGRLTDNQDRDMILCEDLRHATSLAAGTEIPREYRGEDGGLALVSYCSFKPHLPSPSCPRACVTLMPPAVPPCASCLQKDHLGQQSLWYRCRVVCFLCS